MKNITIRVSQAGKPLEGVRLVIGEYANRKFITDKNGEISQDVADEFMICTCVAVQSEDGKIQASQCGMVLEAGQKYEIEV